MSAAEETTVVGDAPAPAPATMSKSAAKKAKREAERAAKKAKKEAERAEADARREAARLERLEELRGAERPPLPDGYSARRSVSVGEAGRGSDGDVVTVSGWAHVVRRQGSKLLFVELRDGTSFPSLLQVVVRGALANTYESATLTREAAITVSGSLRAIDQGRLDARDPAKAGRIVPLELEADAFVLVGPSDADYSYQVTEDSGADVRFTKRHLVVRELRTTYILKLRHLMTRSLKQHMRRDGYTEVWPPTIVQTQVEGGSTLFKLDFFGTPAYMTQSSQLYLETVVPVLGKVFCNASSFRAESSHTKRHLAEFTHFEAELGNITFDDLLAAIEDLVVNTAQGLLDAAPDLVRELNPRFAVPKKPFRRMDYADAIKFCRDNGIYKDEETKEHFAFGDDIPEAPERKMTDMIGEPILLCRFPAKMKSFYMKRCPEDPELTESVDLLMPGVGEVVGGSMRMSGHDELVEAFKREGIDPKPYYWYTDLRKYGNSGTGGYGLGSERLMCCLFDIDTVKEVCTYPRFAGRCRP